MYSYGDIFTNKKRVLFIGAHPDDVDVFFGGTIALLNKEGKNINVLLVTNGGKGYKDNKITEKEIEKIRTKEEESALKFLGVTKDHFFTLGHPDGKLEYSYDFVGEIVYYIKKLKPEIVCTHDPNFYYAKFLKTNLSHINHHDHRVTGLAVIDAVYPYSRHLSFYPEQNLPAHNVYELFLSGGNDFDTKIDISLTVESKSKALLCHKSQFDNKTVEEIISDFKENNRFYETGKYLKLAY